MITSNEKKMNENLNVENMAAPMESSFPPFVETNKKTLSLFNSDFM